jgi:hypothetical protein
MNTASPIPQLVQDSILAKEMLRLQERYGCLSSFGTKTQSETPKMTLTVPGYPTGGPPPIKVRMVAKPKFRISALTKDKKLPPQISELAPVASVVAYRSRFDSAQTGITLNSQEVEVEQNPEPTKDVKVTT